ncbi:MAG: transcriptional regulator [Lamprobacter sp.]|uniref:HVO_A0114 family putative DNA-binding protein n=1 Tax=Lamprobacter sp. TaxID=3100796 RepID=UPI002B2600BB|nr:transcriptional regulator [Lamprobacter sp.]MEA3642939.1 transcriptional regulator [Lamprobacter sp.]
MSTLIIDVSDLETVKARLERAFRGEPQAQRYSFRSEARLLSMLTPDRWGLIKALTGADPLSGPELANRVGRDVTEVLSDAERLVQCGLVDKTSEGKFHLPYEKVCVELVCQAAA